MVERPELKLRWAFLLALALHGLALAAAARLPQLQARAGELTQIQVFDAAAPVVVSHVSLAEWPPPSASPVIAPVTPVPDAVVTPEGPAAWAPPPAPPVRPVANRRPQTRPGGTRSPEAVPAPAGQGGGGAPVAGGPGSEAGTVPGTGGTGPTGETPGEGSGRGTGEGSGAGPAAGAGSEGGGAGSPEPPGRDTPGEGPGRAAPPPPMDRQEPEVIYKGRLSYPEAALAEGAEGTCVLRVLVGEKGEVLEVKVTQSAGAASLDKAAVEFVRHWQYRPAVQAGQPRRVSTRATVQFALD